ncbi:replication-relaxation family protein [Brevifollis gellanilyticus]|uniref:replication-relaxation family protein n=1 Tax=Brevifollis gellanilyticus TaxID=748831 RepID=UPI0011BDAE5B|nr:replication-relaxation family protein [Brevifollis gellanilyticus]
MQRSQHRLPRFRRDPESAGALQLTKRDIDLLCHAAEHRFITSDWLVKLAGGSSQQILRRLNLLYHHGYLDRPRSQLDYYHEGGSRRLVYALASRGAGRLRRDLDMPFNRMSWVSSKSQVGRVYLKHAVMISSFMSALEVECSKRSNVRLIYGSHSFSAEGGQGRPRAPQWCVDLPGRRRVSVVPDKIFSIEIQMPDGKLKKLHYLLEADMGTMPINRNGMAQSSILRKATAYGTLTNNQFATYFGSHDRPAIVIVTNGKMRARHIASSLGSKFRTRLLVTDHDARESSSDWLGLLLPSSLLGPSESNLNSRHSP